MWRAADDGSGSCKARQPDPPPDDEEAASGTSRTTCGQQSMSSACPFPPSSFHMRARMSAVGGSGTPGLVWYVVFLGSKPANASLRQRSMQGLKAGKCEARVGKDTLSAAQHAVGCGPHVFPGLYAVHPHGVGAPVEWRGRMGSADAREIVDAARCAEGGPITMSQEEQFVASRHTDLDTRQVKWLGIAIREQCQVCPELDKYAGR